MIDFEVIAVGSWRSVPIRPGENSIVVYAINQSIGEPIPIQHIETQKIHAYLSH